MTRRVVLMGAMAIGAVAACGSEGPSTDERRVCDAVQKIVDDLAAGRSQEAIDTLTEFQRAVTDTTNEAMSTAGADFFEVLGTSANRWDMTPRAVDEFGNQLLVDFTSALDAVVAECRDVGSSVERLPQA